MNDVDLYYALEYGGVANWEGYHEALKSAEEDGVDWEELSESARLVYLVDAGVENWRCYDKSIERYKEEHMEG